MTRISNNSFTKDGIGQRQARLTLIQHNAVSITTLLGATPPDLQSWLSNCNSSYDTRVLDADATRNEASAKTQSSERALIALKEELAACKQYILSFYADDPDRRREYGIEGDLPNKAEDIVRVAKNVRDTAAQHSTDNLPHVLPEDRRELLADRITAYLSAANAQGDSVAARTNAKVGERNHFKDDTKMLRKLLSLWVNRVGKDDERIALIGMVVPTGGGRRGVPGIPALQLSITGDSITIVPDTERPEPTSYQSDFRQADGGSDWEEFANNESRELLLTDPRIAGGVGYEFRTRARNARGFSEWSQLLRIDPR